MSQLNEAQTPIAPPPPPPPSPPPFHSYQKVKLNSKALNPQEFSKSNENELDVALDRLLSSDLKCFKIFYKFNTYCVPQLQDGPKCGLVALSIATSVLKTFINVDEIFATAVSLHFTNQGEMFSVNSLAYLAEKCCRFKTRIIKEGLNAHLNCILKCLMRKSLLLVPYDADFNHYPCCKKGAKAHWALITGFVLTQRKKQGPSGEESDFVVLESPKSSALCECLEENDPELDVSAHQGRIKVRKRGTPLGIEKSSEGRLYLVGMQGKSRHLGLWLFEEMAESNDNLVFFSNDRDSDCCVLPQGGLVEGLKGKAIVLEYS